MIAWHLKDESLVGYYAKYNDKTAITPNHYSNVNISHSERHNTLKISQYSSDFNGIYCQITTEETEVFCETKQVFKIKGKFAIFRKLSSSD